MVRYKFPEIPPKNYSMGELTGWSGAGGVVDLGGGWPGVVDSIGWQWVSPGGTVSASMRFGFTRKQGQATMLSLSHLEMPPRKEGSVAMG